ncbi:2-amino-4-hydroxy-6-hydroxymethyldihydropteridine diphosphokinase [Xylophilus rhododendri]|uniref:2-amino-4-hydroxy-6-hydroxymethyldihydropteridine pyrophosphokinase n=1 Tax=Xylophilus rhododendri TaxID=2697032 RepID=A0A857J2T3_9BURK|nr:2-amino-4-hydroxy-6-hydroxymethyldihydropteridine diphosphokinase [Xylophilus rhododendri]QHI97361.1 2-amino-4-hydroxy-6-hydroxymethyldihydropteridine diphosphokinase [Xylophilus rhododendri]
MATPPEHAPAPTIAYIGIGANLGDARAAVRGAFEAIAQLPATSLVRRSCLYRSAPVGTEGPDYLNAVAAIATGLAPLDLLAALQNMENAAGRTRPFRWAPRTLDLDLLLYGDAHIDLPQLTVPHPRMWERAFVLYPLAEIAPQLVPAAALAATAGQAVERLADA